MFISFSDDELSFLKRVYVSPHDVMDVRGWLQSDWRQAIREEGKTLAYGNPCTKRGHRLKTHGAHCVQCDPKKLVFQRRFGATASVYIAGAQSKQLIKIGMARDVYQRIGRLQYESYGGCGDWRLLTYLKIQNAGYVEHTSRDRLREYATKRWYFKDGIPQDGIDLLMCSLAMALQSLSETTSEPLTTFWLSEEAKSGKYEFACRTAE